MAVDPSGRVWFVQGEMLGFICEEKATVLAKVLSCGYALRVEGVSGSFQKPLSRRIPRGRGSQTTLSGELGSPRMPAQLLFFGRSNRSLVGGDAQYSQFSIL